MKHLYHGGNTSLSITRLSKKNRFFTTLLLLTCCCCCTQLFAGSSEIIISQKTRSLIAPEGDNYQWYYNNKPLKGESAQNLKVTESGFYTVVLSDKKGKQTTFTTAIAVTAFAIKRVFTIGDSTVANYNSGYYPQTGWGQVLQYFFNSAEVSVVNKAVGGTSSKSFYDIYWSAIRNSLVAGDYVFIQFGINDSNKSDPARYTEPSTTFKDYLTKYVNETKARGAIPVLVSTLCRNAWNSTSPPTVYPAYHGYPVATRELAASLNVALVDLDRLSIGLLESVGPAYSGPYLYMNLAAGEYPNYSSGKADNVHFQEAGAIEMARLVTQGLRNINSPLVSSMVPTYAVNVSQNNTNAGLVTRTQSFPAGINVTLKVKPNSGYTFQKWVDGAGATVSTSQRFTFTMGSAARTYRAMYPTSSTSITVQENTTGFCGVDGTVDNNNAGFTGTGFANTNNVIGSGIKWRVNAPSSGNYTLLFRHSNGGTTDRTAKLIVNGATAISSISFPSTGNFTTWADVSVNITLPAGGSNIRLEALTSSGASNIDYLRVTGSSPTVLTCSGTTAAARPESSLLLATDLEDVKDVVSVYPNPSNQQFTIQSKGDFKYSVSDLSGRTIEKGEGKDSTQIGSSLAPGTYVLSIDRQGTVKIVKIIKN